MLADTLTITYNAVSVTLNKVTEANFKSKYYAEGSGIKYHLDVQHTVPAAGQPGESHLVKLTVEHFDSNGVYVRSAQAWTVVRSPDAPQDSVASTRCANALTSLTTSGFVTLLVGRQS